jgi:hypothetical protein
MILRPCPFCGKFPHVVRPPDSSITISEEEEFHVQYIYRLMCCEEFINCTEEEACNYIRSCENESN